jgi:hypothetical protein
VRLRLCLHWFCRRAALDQEFLCVVPNREVKYDARSSQPSGPSNSGAYRAWPDRRAARRLLFWGDKDG